MAKKKQTKYGESFGCMYCSFLCYNKEQQVAHYVEKHTGKEVKNDEEPPYKCDFCGDKYRTQEGLNHHLQTNHQKSLI